MKRIRSIVIAAGALATVALVGWIVVTLLTHVFRETADTPENAGAAVESVDTGWAPDLFGVVQLVDAARGKITLAIATVNGKEQEQVYDLAKDAEVLLEGPATLDELPAGTRVAVKFGTGSKDVVAIRSEPFRITVEPKQEEVEVGKPFDAVLRVANASLTAQSFWVMFTTWDMNWRSTNPHVVWEPLYSYMNGPVQVKLAAGEVYEKTLAIRVTATGPVSFKLGFTPLADERMGVVDKRTNRYGEVRMKLNLGERTYWSREVTLKVNH